MSYILEALKKAQAERQLGAAPDVHAPTIDAYAARSAARPAWGTAVVAGVAVVGAVGVALWWRQAAAPGQQAPAQPVAALPAAMQQTTAQTPAVQSAPAQRAVAQPSVIQSMSAQQANAQPPASPSRKAQPAVAQPPERPAVDQAPAVQPAAPAPQAAQAAAPVKPATPPEPPDDAIPTARDLPEPIQRILPAVAMSGYMYSKNPADRLVLIDKALRREGDEVAPGLVLERLLPKGAVFTFRGYRYRVPY